jgi:assimilatory nitrate reductase catalytic subunit
MPKLPELLRQFEGPLTEDLVLHPAKFGLGKVPKRLKPDDTTTVVCGFCSTGCGLNIHLRDGQAINLTPSTDYPVNLGMACPKGWEALTPLSAPDRATTPLLRDKSGKLQPVDWDEAMQIFTLRFKAILDQHGPDSVAYISTGQIVTEEMAFLGCLAKFGMGIIHGDGNTRQCMATAATAYKQSFGFDAPPFTYEDFEQSDVIVLVGSNLCAAHPIMWQRILRNPHKPEIIVVDPRKTETAMAATQHYAPSPKSDLILFYGLAEILIRNNWIDRQFIETQTNGFDDFAKHVRKFHPQTVSTATGISVEDLEKFAAAIHNGKRVSFWWTMGVNQSHEGTRLAQALINLALMTGNIGRPGTGANSITGQCNAMGSRIFSNNTNLIGGHDFTRAEDREKIARALDIPIRHIPTRNSWAYDEIIDGIRTGKIKGLWVIATNTVHSWINQNEARDVLDKLDFLVVQDMYHTTETAQRAHLVLPAAGWGEKEGTFINSERRIGLTKKVSRSPGEALSDFHIFRLVAHYWGCGELFKRWTSPEAVFQLMKRCSEGQPCDITGIENYRMLDENGGVQWPWPAAAGKTPAQQRRLFSDGQYFHPDGRAKFHFEDPRPAAETPDREYPFALLTGRGSAAQWHTQTRTGKSAVLRSLYPDRIYVEINPTDASDLSIRDGDSIQIRSRRGSITARAFVTSIVQPGQVFIPMHYATANQLTFPEFDPYSRQPSYKMSAVALARA